MPHRITVGDAEITALTDTRLRIPARNVYQDIDPAALEAYREFMDDAGTILLNFTAYLLRIDGRTVLIDTGVGPERSGQLPGELEEAGASPSDVDIVAHSHLHGDHYGWSLIEEKGRFRPRFPNARYLVPAPTGTGSRATRRALPNRGTRRRSRNRSRRSRGWA